MTDGYMEPYTDRWIIRGKANDQSDKNTKIFASIPPGTVSERVRKLFKTKTSLHYNQKEGTIIKPSKTEIINQKQTKLNSAFRKPTPLPRKSSLSSMDRIAGSLPDIKQMTLNDGRLPFKKALPQDQTEPGQLPSIHVPNADQQTFIKGRLVWPNVTKSRSVNAKENKVKVVDRANLVLVPPRCESLSQSQQHSDNTTKLEFVKKSDLPINSLKTSEILQQPMSKQNSSINSSEFDHNTKLNNGLQICRQPKYKKREKSQRNIKHLEHLERNKKCNRKFKKLEKSIHSQNYENQPKLHIIQNKVESAPAQHRLWVSAENVSETTPRNENIYEEIDESKLPPRRPATPSAKRRVKKVMFANLDPSVHGREEIVFNKKIIPAILYGIVDIMTPLRNLEDKERRKIALLAYTSVIQNLKSHTIQFLGKIDTSRKNEDIFIIIDKDGFEVRDSDSVLLAKHRITDISVIMDVPNHPNDLIYIGRCRISGRIALVAKFTKPKYASMIINLLRNN